MSVITNVIEERLAGSGVTIDGLLVQDGGLPNLQPSDIGAEVAGAAATAVADHEIAYNHANIPTGDFFSSFSQSGTSNPTGNTKKNTTGLTFTFTRVNTGAFSITPSNLAGAETNYHVDFTPSAATPRHVSYTINAGVITLVSKELTTGNSIDGLSGSLHITLVNNLT